MINKKPRILVFNHGLRLGGVERSLIGLLRAIPADAALIDLMLLEHEGELLTDVPEHIRVIPPRPEHAALIGPIRQALFGRHFAIGMARLLARLVVTARSLMGLPPGFLLSRSFRYALPFLPRVEGHYDLAISFMMPHDIVAKRVSASRKAGWIHTDYTSVPMGVATCFESADWGQMDRIISISTEVTQSFTKVFPEHQHRVVLIENSLDPSWVRNSAAEGDVPEVTKDGRIVLCSVGRLTYQKAFDEAPIISRRLRELGVAHRWYIIGFGPDEDLIRGKIVEYGVEDSVVLLGKKTNPYPYINACDIYVQPSRYEGKAVAVREAQMLGKPVVIAGFSTASSQLEDGVDGIIAGPGVEGLTEALRQVASDPLLRDRLSRGTLGRDYGNLSEAAKVLALLPPDPA